jgi:N-acetylmuramoyl-L-alanine amidase
MDREGCLNCDFLYNAVNITISERRGKSKNFLTAFFSLSEQGGYIMFLQWKIHKMLTLMLFLVLSSVAWGQAVEAAPVHRVAPSDTLWQIARSNNTTVADLKTANRLTSALILPGQLIRIPVHTVSPGDTMWGIARRFGTGLPALLAVNPRVSPAHIFPGQLINIPAADLAAADPVRPGALPSRGGQRSGGGHNFSQQEINLLARLVHAEAAGEPFVGQVAVAASVLNRLISPIFPNTLRDVIYQVAYGFYQYSPVLDDRIYLPANRTAYQAVFEALAGWDPSLGALGFFNPRKTDNQWVRQQSVTTVIGNHVFFR